MNWTTEELNTIGKTREIKIAPLKKDGTIKSPKPIWVVRSGDGLFVRSWLGQKGAWYRAAHSQHEGQILVNRKEKNVSFEDVTDDALNDQIDEAYLEKYGRTQYTRTMTGSEQRSTTIKLIPR